MMVVISQPRYLPALNYLQRLFFAEKFVVLDVVQRQARGWENRNKLLLPDPSWLTIPVASSSRALIVDAKINGVDWLDEHKDKIHRHYRGAPFFKKDLLEAAYALSSEDDSYVNVLVRLLRNACRLLGFEPNLVFASEVLRRDEYAESGVGVLRKICERVGADSYVSGPNGRDYGVAEEFFGSGIELLFHEFKHPDYSQGGHAFSPYMGYLDALFYCGIDWVNGIVRGAPDLRGCND